MYFCNPYIILCTRGTNGGSICFYKFEIMKKENEIKLEVKVSPGSVLEKAINSFIEKRDANRKKQMGSYKKNVEKQMKKIEQRGI